MTDWTEGAAWVGGEIVPLVDAKIHVTDWGLTRSDITYDVAPVREGGFFRLDDYLDRFEASMAALRLDPGVTRAEMKSALHAIVARSGLRESYVSMTCARGRPLVAGSRDPRDCANHFYAWAVPFIHVVKPEVIARGARLWVAKNVRRIPEDSVNPRAKNYHWGDFTAGIFEANDAGYDNVVLLDHAGNVTEGPGFNVFAVKNGRVITSDHGVLHGITRRTVLEMCAEVGLNVETRPLPVDELLEADEVFLSSTGGGVMPVVEVAGRIFGNGAHGPEASRLAALYREWIRRPEWREEVAYAA
ncbi:branched-chain amino acid--2-keto-4-methylthiobutyrate aminotransferase [Pikeienuella piscinae]|uniref:Probable branched-chain-amino-acid aminotransferase n=1 Tax=Pikeienuella piscinae TaxID=2748098 RepID=A0A7L5BXE3_9RHOB|nr:aminotransferase class IV [Pikeienuella piscinae]QIE55518.1 branched-chain amino acid--2-keto-4-methylthiobutyrate aminotransferase [Pikeienuella piscinae]